MIGKFVLAVVIAIVVTIGCNFIGEILGTVDVDIAVTTGKFLVRYAAAFGILAGLWFFFRDKIGAWRA